MTSTMNTSESLKPNSLMDNLFSKDEMCFIWRFHCRINSQVLCFLFLVHKLMSFFFLLRQQALAFQELCAQTCTSHYRCVDSGAMVKAQCHAVSVYVENFVFTLKTLFLR